MVDCSGITWRPHSGGSDHDFVDASWLADGEWCVVTSGGELLRGKPGQNTSTLARLEASLTKVFQ